MVSARPGIGNRRPLTYRVVLMLSKGVTASSDSVIPAPNPAITVRGPDILPCSSCSRVLYVSKATNPVRRGQSTSRISTDRPRRTYPSFQRVPNYQRRASCVPGFSKRRPTQLLPVWQSSVELGSSLGDYGVTRSGSCVSRGGRMNGPLTFSRVGDCCAKFELSVGSTPRIDILMGSYLFRQHRLLNPQ